MVFKQLALETMTEEGLKAKTAEAELFTEAVLDAFKTFAKETLSELR